MSWIQVVYFLCTSFTTGISSSIYIKNIDFRELNEKNFREHLFLRTSDWKSFTNIYFCESKKNIQNFKNMFAIFSIKTCRMNENKTDGHLPREISRATKFLPRQRSKRNSFIFNPLPKVSFFPGRLRDSLYRKGLLHCQHQS